MQHRQVEPAAVPGNELRRVFLDAVEKAPDQLGFSVLGRAQRPDADAVAFAQRAGDGDDAVLRQLQEIVVRGGTAALKSDRRHVLVGEPGIQIVQPPQAVAVVRGFDVESEDGSHGILSLRLNYRSRQIIYRGDTEDEKANQVSSAASASAAVNLHRFNPGKRRWKDSGRRGRRRWKR